MPRPSRLRVAVPPGYGLPQGVCSYGYFLLAPNRWRPLQMALERSFNADEFGLPPEPFCATIDQPAGRGAPLRVRCDRPVSAAALRALRAAVVRMLRLDHDLADWERAAPAAKRRGFGRMFRSATLFEDMVKTVTSCNVAWPSTVRMNERLVERVGEGAFPSPERLARWTPARLQKVCRVGYRAKRLLRLARAFVAGEIDPAWFESADRATEEVRAALLRLEGFGPYSAANVLQLLGHVDELPIDTETYRLFCKKHGVERPANPLKLHAMIEAHYEPFRPNRFLAYWCELWRDYERQRGDAWTWNAEEVGTSFTASRLDRDSAGGR